MIKTITFSEENKGWTSFWNYAPNGMCSVDNRFFTIKNGQFFLHNDQENPLPNTFYGETSPSKIVFYFNEDPTNDKIFKTIEIEGTHVWDVLVKTNFTQGDILKEEFSKKESRFYAYIRKNSVGETFMGIGTQGIGEIQDISGDTISFSFIPESINVGDMLYQDPSTPIGEISSIDFTTKTLEVQDNINTPIVDSFCFAQKPVRIEGAEIRGYFMEVELTNYHNQLIELFAINTNAIKSYV